MRIQHIKTVWLSYIFNNRFGIKSIRVLAFQKYVYDPIAQ